MKKGLLLGLSAILFFQSCAPKYSALMGNYLDSPFEITTDLSYEDTWSNIVELFATSGLSISVIDKSSGLIVSQETSLRNNYTFEGSNGKPIKSNAWVVLGKINVGGVPYTPEEISGIWNVRIKKLSDVRTLINVNLTNINATSYIPGTSYTKAQNLVFEGKSTGVFEQSIADLIKGKSSMKPTAEVGTSKTSLPITSQVTKSPNEQTTAKIEMVNKPSIANAEIQKMVAENAVLKQDINKMRSQIDQAQTLLAQQKAEQDRISTELRKNQLDMAQLREEINQLKSIPKAEKFDQSISNVTPTQTYTPPPSAPVYNTQGDITIQFLASSSENENIPNLSDIGDLIVEKVEGKRLYRYKVGYFHTVYEAETALTKMKQRGYKDAFVVK